MMEAKMFCYQCQETMKGTGCILKGVCGKESHTAKAMDLLMFVVRGISVVTDEFRNAGHPVAAEVNRFVVDALFCTITNANFDDESILNRVDKGMILRNRLIEEALNLGLFETTRSAPPPKAHWLRMKGINNEYNINCIASTDEGYDIEGETR